MVAEVLAGGSVALPETADSSQKKQILEESARACVAVAHEPQLRLFHVVSLGFFAIFLTT